MYSTYSLESTISFDWFELILGMVSFRLVVVYNERLRESGIREKTVSVSLSVFDCCLCACAQRPRTGFLLHNQRHSKRRKRYQVRGCP